MEKSRPELTVPGLTGPGKDATSVDGAEADFDAWAAGAR